MLDDLELRKVYADAMMELAAADPRIVALQADLTGAHGMKGFQKAYPDRSFNVGIAEANMVGVAAGLAACGKIPFVHSFATFSTRRCFDQIAISVCYAGLNVKIIGSDPGAGAALNGGTHMALEDVAIMRSLPGMTIVEPIDAEQMKQAVPEIAAHDGPVYLRLFRKNAEKIFDSSYKFRWGKADVLREGSDVTLIASGICVAESLKAADMLAAKGISASVLAVHTIKPIDAEAVVAAAAKTGAVVTAENHSVINGLGSAVAEVLAENLPTPMERVGTKDRFGEVGKTPALIKALGISAEDIVSAAQKAVSRKAR